MRWLSRSLCTCIFLCCALPGLVRARTIVVVDSEKVHRKSREGRRVLKQIDKIKKKKQKVVDRKKRALKKEYDAIMKAAKVLANSRKMMKPRAYKAKQEKLQQRYMRWGGKMQQWQQYALQQQQQLNRRASGLLAVFRTKLQAKIETLAQLRRYKLVVDKSAVWYAKKTIDITDAVIRVMNGN
jgi:Skp family chaperone for outer membrane proteins